MPLPTDVFARIGLAFQRLADNSTVNGPARTEILRLATELQGLEDRVDDIAIATVSPLLEVMEGRMRAFVAEEFGKLADAMEQGGSYRPADPPVLLPTTGDPSAANQDPATPPPPANEQPMPTTGNQPAPPVDGQTGEALPEPVGQLPETPVVEPGNDTIVTTDNSTIMGGQGADSIDADGGNDTLAGGQGDDSLTGGQGADTIDAG